MAARREGGGSGGSGSEPTLVWERPEPPERPAPSPLSRERIVRAAVELADADGLEAVSLRKVAAALDAGPMRLYRYLSTKEELIDLMADAVYGEMAGPLHALEGDWRAVLRALAHRVRDAVLRHEWFAELLGGRPHLGPEGLAYLERSLAALHSAPGFEDLNRVMRAVEAVNAYVVGAVRREVTERRAERVTGMSEEQWQRTVAPYLARLRATGRYPTLARVMDETAHLDFARTFDAGLTVVLDGVAAGLRT
ncbi:TetR/AcrR family transcriptional regulator C-terminal domain-containing protein [Streptomyces albiaxialis]|uniref:TetR/AcrR family transcriptional regulator C-terminal domain-containing protein n=1 Tax=Streptomyces albiaxialis TaxID=329523 RepID=A0ABN2VYM2_9ACTN